MEIYFKHRAKNRTACYCVQSSEANNNNNNYYWSGEKSKNTDFDHVSLYQNILSGQSISISISIRKKLKQQIIYKNNNKAKQK